MHNIIIITCVLSVQDNDDDIYNWCDVDKRQLYTVRLARLNFCRANGRRLCVWHNKWFVRDKHNCPNKFDKIMRAIRVLLLCYIIIIIIEQQ